MRTSTRVLGKVVLVIVAATGLTLGTYSVVRSHCEIPCGIYGDKTRIALLYEHVATVEKSMKMIDELMASEPPDANQVVRWVNNKEEHANKIQHIVTQYFMTQRVKPKAPATAARGKYVEQLTALHEILVAAMKCKQTTKQTEKADHCAQLRGLIDRFAAAYFLPEDLKHVREHHGGKK